MSAQVHPENLDVENFDVENAVGKEDDQKMNSNIGSSALQRDCLKDHEALDASTVDCDHTSAVKHKIDNLLADGADRAVAEGEVVGAKAFKSYAYFRGPCQLFVLAFLWFVTIFTMQVGTKVLLPSYVYPIDPAISTVSINTDSMDSSASWPLAPSVSVDHCTLLITNPCKPPFRGPYRSECGGESLAGLGGFSTSIDKETLNVKIKPVKFWSSLPVTWQNEAWCNLILVLSDDVDVVIDSGTQKSTVIAEHVRLKSLKIRSNGGDVWFQSKNLSISNYLGFQSPGGGVLVENLSMPTGAQTDISITAGSVDITTESSPDIQVQTISQAVCLVGKFSVNPTRSAQVAQGNYTMSTHLATVACPTTGPCSQPMWRVATGNPLGSVGIHAFSQTPDSSDVSVYSGQAFANGIFASLHPQPEHISFHMVDVTGVGYMKPSLQIVMVSKKIWFSLGDYVSYYLQLFAVFSWFTVMPVISNQKATISFCPAHGFPILRGKKDLLTPIQSILSQAKVGTAQDLFMLFRNLGRLRDGMVPKDYGQNIHLTKTETNLKKDRAVPDCEYCADPVFWTCSQLTGSFRGFTGKCEGFIGKEGCVPDMVSPRAHSFTVHPKSEGGSCFRGDEVAALMTDRETFFKFQRTSDTGDITMATGENDMCITAADMTSLVDNNPVRNYFQNGKIDVVMPLSWIIGAIVAVFIPTVVFKLFKFQRTNYMVTLILQNQNALTDFRHILNESKRFAIISHSDKPEGNPLKGARVLRHLTLENIYPNRSKIQKIASFLGRSRGRQHPKGKTLQIGDLVTKGWLDMSLDLVYLEVDDDGKLKVQNVWDYEKNCLAHSARIVFLPEKVDVNDDEESQMNVDEECQMGWTKAVSDRFKRLQADVFKIAYLVERLQIELNVFFFLGSAMKGRKPEEEIDDEETEVTPPKFSPVPPYWPEIGETVRYFTVFKSPVQELQYILMVFVLAVVPVLCLYCWVVNFFYASLLEKGLAVYGLKSDVTNLQEYVVWSALFYLFFSFFAVASFYYLRAKLWWIPEHAGFSVEGNTISFGDTRTWYKRHMIMSKFSHIFLFGFAYAALFWMLTASTLWICFGMLLEPAKVAAYFTAIVGLVGHVVSMASGMKGFLEDCKVQLKEAIEKFEDKLLEQLQAQMKGLETALGSGVMDTLQEGLKNKEDLKKQYLQMQEEVLAPMRDIQKHEIESLLRKFGVSVEDIVVAVIGSALLLVLVLLFIFIGMAAFQEGDPDAGQAVINSLLTGGAALGSSLSGSGNGADKIRSVIAKLMEEYKKTRKGAELTFGMDEDVTKVLDRASTMHAKKQQR